MDLLFTFVARISSLIKGLVFIVSPVKQKRDICIAFPASSSSAA